MAKVGPKIKLLISRGLPPKGTPDNDAFWKELRAEINEYIGDEDEKETGMPDSTSEFNFTDDGIAAAKKVLDDPYSTPNRRNAATDFLITAHEKGMYK